MAFSGKIIKSSPQETMPLEILPDVPDVIFVKNFISQEDAHLQFEKLRQELNLRPDELFLGGQLVRTKRLFDYRADAGLHYQYSGSLHEAAPWTPELKSIKDAVGKRFELQFNACLCNYYENGSIGMSWHSDNESELGADPSIASVSLGAKRTFRFRRRLPWREKGTYQKWTYELDSGDILLMRGQTQHFFEHELAPSSKVSEPRLNLTFRAIRASSRHK